MENNKNKKPVKFQGDMLNYCDFIQVFVFTSYHHLKDKQQIVKQIELVMHSVTVPFKSALLNGTVAECITSSILLYNISTIP